VFWCQLVLLNAGFDDIVQQRILSGRPIGFDFQLSCQFISHVELNILVKTEIFATKESEILNNKLTAFVSGSNTESV
jgi:hypothetical protein